MSARKSRTILPLVASDALLYPRDFSFFESARYFKGQTEPIQMVRYPKYVLNLLFSDAGLIVFNSIQNV